MRWNVDEKDHSQEELKIEFTMNWTVIIDFDS